MAQYESPPNGQGSFRYHNRNYVTIILSIANVRVYEDMYVGAYAAAAAMAFAATRFSWTLQRIDSSMQER